ncbi:hypothetical protein FO519_006783 [Halicephalobus sp. NKZ332]|nr:hypothetical protein FO519_006783 [Halicephalobus sp. NKZ332]
MDSLPIDIHSTKLLNWLVSRRHCKADADFTEIRRKIGEAIKDMPENDRILQLLAGSYIHYFNCKEIVDILKETEKDSRNIFGSYSSQRMKDWKEILQLYERDNSYLAEAAQLIQRLVHYEIPATNRQISKGENGYEDAVQKQAEYAKQVISSDAAYHAELTKMGIKGENFRKEIIELTKEIPLFLEKILASVGELKSAIEYYDSYNSYATDGSDEVTVLPFLKDLLQKGPFTYYEFVNKKAPSSVERIGLTYVEDSKKEDEIDFGDEAEIDYNGIDFGDDDFKIEVVGDDTGVAVDEIARGEFSLSVLEHPRSLQQFYFELDELITFLHFRYREETEEDQTAVYLSAYDKRSQTLSSVSPETVLKWKGKTEKILQEFNNARMKKLLKARSDPGYVDKIVEDLEKMKLQEQKYKRLGELCVQKQKDSVKTSQEARKQVEVLTNALIYLKEEIEKDIGKKYGRECNIIGEIYNVLP